MFDEEWKVDEKRGNGREDRGGSFGKSVFPSLPFWHVGYSEKQSNKRECKKVQRNMEDTDKRDEGKEMMRRKKTIIVD